MKATIAILLLVIFLAACEKEYSYEGGGVFIEPGIDTVIVRDTIIPGLLSNCNACTNTTGIATGTWSFKANNAKVCGEIDTAFVLNHQRTVLTFFGPSFCGSDSGLIFTVNLATGLTRDAFNIAASYTAYYYYRTAHPNILISTAAQPLNLMFTSYDHNLRIATGIFNGTAYTQNGTAVVISDGKFSFVIK